MFCKLIVVSVIYLVCSSPSFERVKRQGFDWDAVSDESNVTSTSTQNIRLESTSEASTTPSGFMECFRSCPATPEYNPICASNRITYDNENKLKCAVRCGLGIEKVFGGSCRPL